MCNAQQRPLGMQKAKRLQLAESVQVFLEILREGFSKCHRLGLGIFGFKVMFGTVRHPPQVDMFISGFAALAVFFLQR